MIGGRELGDSHVFVSQTDVGYKLVPNHSVKSVLVDSMDANRKSCVDFLDMKVRLALYGAMEYIFFHSPLLIIDPIITVLYLASNETVLLKSIWCCQCWMPNLCSFVVTS